MDIWGITLAVLRRWYVFVAIFGLSVGGAYYAGKGVQPEYIGSASALLTPAPTTAPVANPLGTQLDANGALLIVLNSAETVAAIEAMGYTSTYEVTATARTAVFSVDARGTSEADVLGTLNAVLTIAEDDLLQRQANGGVPAGNRIGMQELAAPSITEVETEGALRVQAVIVVLGGAIAVVLAVLFDDIVGLIRRRRSRREKRRAAADSGLEADQPETAQPETTERELSASDPGEAGDAAGSDGSASDSAPDAAADGEGEGAEPSAEAATGQDGDPDAAAGPEPDSNDSAPQEEQEEPEEPEEEAAKEDPGALDMSEEDVSQEDVSEDEAGGHADAVLAAEQRS